MASESLRRCQDITALDIAYLANFEELLDWI